MKRILHYSLFAFFLFQLSEVRGQASVCPTVNAGADQTVCPGQCVNLTAAIQGTLQTNTYTGAVVPYSPYSYTTGTPVLVNIDDVWTPVINLPFCFQFFGNTYNQMVIGSNGLISFNTAYAGGFCQWAFATAIPTNTVPINAIMAPYHDIDPSIGATSDTRFATYGTAPCRQFVISWYNVPMFSFACNSQLASQQIVLHESTNVIDIYIGNKPLCSSWNGGLATEGIQNATGTVAFWYPGRNASQWATTNSGYRFTPAGAPNYTLTWAGPLGPLGSGNPITVCPTTTSTYTATITNTTCAGPIVVTDQVTVFTTGGGITTSGSQTNVTCNGQCTGSATVNITSGSGPFTYAWAPSGGTAATATGLCAGTYTCTVTNTVGCMTTQTFTITQTPAISIVPTQTNVLCNGQCTGVATATASGGTGVYTYSWAPSGGSAATATGLCIGTYTCTVTSGPVGCTATQVFNITQPTAITSTMASTPAMCSVSNGTASISASGGTGVLTYNWTPGNPTGDGTANITGLAAGVWTCTVTDANGCTHTNTVNVASTSGLTATIASTNALCFGSNGSATASPVGGTGPFTYAWTPSGGTGSTASIPVGSYTCTVTDIGTGCTTTVTVSITQPTAVTATINGSPVLCNGGATGTATVTPGGGVGSYTYAWTPSGGTGATATGLTATTYTCTVTDGNGCTAIATFAVTQPTALSASTSFTQSTCGAANGSASVVVSGGTGGYTYSWLPSGGTAATATGLLAATYTCTITDANNCTMTSIIVVTSANSPLVSILSSTNLSCFGGNDGSATATSTGGTTPCTYFWSNADPDSIAGNLIAGQYTVTVTDANGCSSTTTVSITEPPALTSVISGTDILCFAGTTGDAQVTGTGGTGAYTYLWSPLGGTTSNAAGLEAGTYTCIITDANGCTTNSTITLTEPPLLTVASAGFNVSCFGSCDGQLVAIPAGGAPNYTFVWSAGCTTPSCNNICSGQYTVTVTDANSCTTSSTTTVTEPTAITIVTAAVDAHCNLADGSASAAGAGGTGTLLYQWIGGPATANYNSIVSNTYSVIVTDANGCADTATAIVNNLNSVTAALNTSTNLTCFQSADGSIDIDATGGTPNYTYVWSPSGSATDISTGLPAGVYTVVVTDASGCIATVTTTITEPTLLTVQASANPTAVCIGTPVQLTATPAGGTPIYVSTWNPGALVGNIQNIVPAATTTYTVDVVDANGCTASSTILVTVNALPVAIVGSDVTSGCAPLCVNFDDLSTIVAGTITGWSWDFGDQSSSTQQNPSHCYGLPGNYDVTLTVTTSDGCSQTIVMTNYIQVFALPVAAFIAGPQPTTVLNPTITFTDSSTNASSWNWNFGDLVNSSSTDQNPTFTYVDPNCYVVTLEVTSTDGCMDTTDQIICIGPDVIIFVPNTFTPDDNGLNDLFTPVTFGIDPDKYEMWVFDRWGNVIFYTDDLNDGWDGKVLGSDQLCQEDTYVWKILAKDVLDKRHELIGHVNLIR